MKHISDSIIRYVSLEIALGESPSLVDCIDSLWSVFEEIKGDSRLISREKASAIAKETINRNVLRGSYDIKEIADCLLVFSVMWESISQLSILNGKWTEDRIERILSSVSGQVLDDREGLLGLRHRVRLVGRYWLMDLQERSVNAEFTDVEAEFASKGLDSASVRSTPKDQAETLNNQHDNDTLTFQRKFLVYTDWKPPYVVDASEIEELMAKRDQGKYKIWSREPMSEYYRARMRLVKSPENRLARLGKEVLRNCHLEHIPLLRAYAKLWPEQSRVSITAVLGAKSDIRKAFWELRELFGGYPEVSLKYDDPYPRAVIKKSFSYCLIEPVWENNAQNEPYSRSGDHPSQHQTGI